MSFGFSVGDFVAQALQHLDRLQSGSSPSTNLDSIKYAALSCRHPLEEFLAKIKKFDKSLGVWGKSGVMKSTADKLRWGFGQKEEVRKLQSYLNIHVGTLNILLAEHGLEKMSVSSDEAAAHQLHVRETLDGTRSFLGNISGSLAVQTLVVQSTQTMLTRLFDMISGEFRTSWRSLEEMVAKICVSTQQTYAVILEIKSSLAGPDTRWTFFQAPLVVEDALGCKFPVPSEYDFDLLDTVVKQKFNTGPGSLDVQAGGYEYYKTKNTSDVLSRSTRLLPGTAITMAILILEPVLIDGICPILTCSSTQIIKSPSGLSICRECDLRFSSTEKWPRILRDSHSGIPWLPNITAGEDEPNDTTRDSKRPEVAPDEDIGMFKNIRFIRFKCEDDPLSNDTGEPPSTVSLEHDRGETSKTTRGPIEFNTAIAFVNKVETRVTYQPEIYRRFFEILLVYRRESKPVQEVYNQYTDLFNLAPDLLEGFKQFLPKSCAQVEARSAQTSTSNSNEEGEWKRKRD